MNNVVYSLTTYDGRLIAGGAFSQSGENPSHSIAAWDGVLWSPLGRGVGGVPEPRVYALVEYDGELIAGGNFTEAGDGEAFNVARWDGTSWSSLGSGVSGAVYALTLYNGRLIAGGDFIYAGGNKVNCIAQWDGLSWSGLGSGLDCVDCGNAFAVLSLGVHENGALIAGGWFNYAGGIRANYIASWSGSWAPLDLGMDYPVSAIIDYNGDLIAGGAFSHAGGQIATGIARWDGASWSPLGDGVVGWYNWVRALAVYNGELIAGGYFVEAGGKPANHIARWYGGSWSVLDEGTDGPVASLAATGSLLIVGGDFDNAGGIEAHKIASWGELIQGACCRADGRCTVTAEVDCVSPDIWHGQGTICDPNPCFYGSCCLQYVCDLYTESDCVARGGVFGGNGTLCNPNPCVSSVDDASPAISLHLSAAPNPSTGQVAVRYRLPKPMTVTIDVFNAAGAFVRRLADGAWPAGEHMMQWDGRDQNGNALPSGMYVARMVTPDGTTSGRLVLTR
jgi:hypothetical protein